MTISGLTIRNARKTDSGDLSGGGGGGIYNDHATLTVTNSTLSGNISVFGGGICNNGRSGSATVTVSNTTLSRNRGGGQGGAIYNDGQSGSATLMVTNTTTSGNSAGSGAGIANLGASGNATLTVTNSTLNNDINSDGIGEEIFNRTATVTIGNTILNTPVFLGFTIRNFSGTVTSNGYNLSSDGGVTNIGGGTGALNATGDQTNTDPQLGPLAYYGGPMPTHIPLTGSPAIDKGKNFSASTTDQRGPGFARTVDGPTGNATGGDGTDIGAFERQASEIDPTLIVTTTADTNANSTCDPANPCSLRDAITAANASAPDDVIYFAVTGTITLNSLGALPNFGSNMRILGPGANALTVKRDSAASNFRIFTINSWETITISGVTISGGAAATSGGFSAIRGAEYIIFTER